MKYWPSATTDRATAAIASAPRRALIERVAAGPATMTQLADHLGVTLPAIDKHVRVLRDARLVIKRKQGRVATVSLDPTGFDAISDWIASTTTMWRAHLTNFTSYVEGTSTADRASASEPGGDGARAQRAGAPAPGVVEGTSTTLSTADDVTTPSSKER